jgi:hypothetical protein
MSEAAETTRLVMAHVSIARVGYGLHLARLARESDPVQLDVLLDELQRCLSTPTLTQQALAIIAHGQLHDRCWCEDAAAGAAALVIAHQASC